jgi:hypothetical protein
MLVAVQVTGALPLTATKPPVGAPSLWTAAQPIKPSSAALPEGEGLGVGEGDGDGDGDGDVEGKGEGDTVGDGVGATGAASAPLSLLDAPPPQAASVILRKQIRSRRLIAAGTVVGFTIEKVGRDRPRDAFGMRLYRQYAAPMSPVSRRLDRRMD